MNMNTLSMLIAPLLMLTSQSASATEIVQDGTFQNSIGTGLNLTPWSDWTNAGITRSAAPDGIPGNYAALPVGGDLFQHFDPLTNGSYSLSFLARNQSPSMVALVVAVQQAFGTPYSTIRYLGLGKELYLPIDSGFGEYQINFSVDSPSFNINELYFSNSYNYPEKLIYDSINPPSTVIDIANVSLEKISNDVVLSVPEPATWLMLIAGFGFIGATMRQQRRTSRSFPHAEMTR